MKTLKIEGARVWRNKKDGWANQEVFVRDGIIHEVADAVSQSADETIDAGGKWLVPGVIDPHVHMREPGAEHKEDLHTGSLACAAGGVTTFLDMPNNSPVCTTQALVEEKKALAAKRSIVNYGFFIGATDDNIAELKAASGACGIKLFMGSSTGNLLVHETDKLERLFKGVDCRTIITIHCENEQRVQDLSKQYRGRTDVKAHSLIRDTQAAVMATRQAIELSKKFSQRIHIAHVSTSQEVELLRGCGDLVTAEAAPHHLLHNTGDYDEFGFKLKMNPPLKEKADNQALWQGLKEGVINCIATDHAPHTIEEKSGDNVWKVPSGIPAIENSLGLMLDAARRGLCDFEEVFFWMCQEPAKVYGLGGKGRIEVGLDADLCIIDPDFKHTIENAGQFSKCKWSPWDGRTYIGWPVTTIVGGQVAFDQGRPNLDCKGQQAK